MSNAARILAGLVAGLLLGTLGAWAGLQLGPALGVTAAIGGLWLDALRMTVVPLVFALVVTGIAAAAATASASAVTRRALILFALLLLFSAVTGAILGSALLGAWSPPPGALLALRTGLGASEVPQIPPVAEWLRSLVPTNVVSAAAEGAIVPLTLFALLFGLAAAAFQPSGPRRCSVFLPPSPIPC